MKPELVAAFCIVAILAAWLIPLGIIEARRAR
jgi:hypothetical protein